MTKSIRELVLEYVNSNLIDVKRLYFSKDKRDKSNLITSIYNSNESIKNRKVITNYLREYFNSINDSKSVNTDIDIEIRIKSIENLIGVILKDVEILKQNKVIHPNRIDSDKQEINKIRFTTYLTESNIEKIQTHAKELNQPITGIVNHIIDFYFLNLNH